MTSLCARVWQSQDLFLRTVVSGLLFHSNSTFKSAFGVGIDLRSIVFTCVFRIFNIKKEERL